METITDSTFSIGTVKSIPTVLQSLETVLKSHNFGTLFHLDMAQTLRDKGQPSIAEFHVLEVCNPARAYDALSTSQQAGYFLPCKLVVFENEQTHQTEVGMQRPTSMIAAIANADTSLIKLATEVEQILTEVIIQVAQQ